MTRDNDKAVSRQDALRECPFCGGKVFMHRGQNDIGFVTCGQRDDGSDGCGAIVSFRPNLSGQKAVAAWNRRPALLSGGGDDDRDAARYRWLRDNCNPGFAQSGRPWALLCSKIEVRTWAHIDAAIDAAMPTTPEATQ